MPLTDDAFTSLLNILTSTQPTPSLVSEAPKEMKTTPVIQTKPKTCQHVACKKKLMLSDFACRCENYYCGAHRHAESHACAYDFKKQGSTQLEKQLVKAVAYKLDRV